MSGFYLLTIVNNAAKNIGIQISLQDPALNSLGLMPRTEMSRSYGHPIFSFWGTAFQSVCSILHSNKLCKKKTKLFLKLKENLIL